MKKEKLNIVIVEDSVIIQEWLKGIIAGFKDLNLIFTADNAGEAIEFICSNKTDLIILDIKLMDSSGIAVLKKIKLLLPEIIIIVYTNYVEYKLQCKIMGCDYFIDKSDDGKTLVNLLEIIDMGMIK